MPTCSGCAATLMPRDFTRYGKERKTCNKCSDRQKCNRASKSQADSKNTEKSRESKSGTVRTNIKGVSKHIESIRQHLIAPTIVCSLKDRIVLKVMRRQARGVQSTRIKLHGILVPMMAILEWTNEFNERVKNGASTAMERLRRLQIGTESITGVSVQTVPNHVEIDEIEKDLMVVNSHERQVVDSLVHHKQVMTGHANNGYEPVGGVFMGFSPDDTYPQELLVDSFPSQQTHVESRSDVFGLLESTTVPHADVAKDSSARTEVMAGFLYGSRIHKLQRTSLSIREINNSAIGDWERHIPNVAETLDELSSIFEDDSTRGHRGIGLDSDSS